jgi:hypothetical protein
MVDLVGGVYMILNKYASDNYLNVT